MILERLLGLLAVAEQGQAVADLPVEGGPNGRGISALYVLRSVRPDRVGRPQTPPARRVAGDLLRGLARYRLQCPSNGWGMPAPDVVRGLLRSMGRSKQPRSFYETDGLDVLFYDAAFSD